MDFLMPENYQFNLPENMRPTTFRCPEKRYPGIETYWENSTSRRIYHPINDIRAIVIHATAGSTSRGAVSVMKKGAASFHWLIPDEDEVEHGSIIWSCVPEALAAWHVRNDKFHEDIWAGKNKINHWSLGIELVNTQFSNDGFSDWQVKTCADIVRYCWVKYPNLKYIFSHAKVDPLRRSDPGGNFPWERFKLFVLSDIKEQVLDNNDAKFISVSDVEEAGCCSG